MPNATKNYSKHFRMDSRKVFVLGNSHVACLKNAWDLIEPEFPGVSLQFFADRGHRLRGLYLESSKLVPPNDGVRKSLEFTSGGLGDIDLREPNAILTFGLGLRPFIRDDVFYSSAVRKAAVHQHATRSTPFLLAQQIRQIFSGLLYVGHNPLPACSEDARGGGAVSHYVNKIRIFQEEVFDQLGVKLLLQPTATLANSMETLSEFSTDSVRLSVGSKNDTEAHPEADVYHMNVRFGEIYLREFLSQVETNQA